jgi:hypothetical protein
MRVLLSVLVGIGFAVWASSGVFLHQLPRLVAERLHAAEFRPAGGSRIIAAKCSNWNLILFTVCTSKAVTADGRVLEFKDWGLGRTASEPVRLLQTSAVEPLYTTSLSLTLMTQCMLALCVVVPFLALLDGGLLFLPSAVMLRARVNGRTIWQQIQATQAVADAARRRRRR